MSDSLKTIPPTRSPTSRVRHAARAATSAAATRAPDAVAAALIPDFLKGPDGHAPSTSPDYVVMTRFALAHHAGPNRLIPALDAQRAPLPPAAMREGLRVQDALLDVRPHASWKIGAYYVTTLRVTNRAAIAGAAERRDIGECIQAQVAHLPSERVAGNRVGGGQAEAHVVRSRDDEVGGNKAVLRAEHDPGVAELRGVLAVEAAHGAGVGHSSGGRAVVGLPVPDLAFAAGHDDQHAHRL